MPQQPPFVPMLGYTDEQRSLIAGFLLHFREGTLKALASLGSVKAGITSGMAEAEYRYYVHAEAYSRQLLFYVGYPVAKDEMYAPPG